MSNFKLCSLSEATLNAHNEQANKGCEFSLGDFGSVSRKEIILAGRGIMVEGFGHNINSMKKPESGGYTAVCQNASEFATLQARHNEEKHMLAATLAYRQIGKDDPTSFEAVKRDVNLQTNGTYLAALAAIDSEVVSPVFYDVITDFTGQYMAWESVDNPFVNSEVDIASNEVFLFEDSDWGSSRSATTRQLYGKTITIPITPKTANTTMKWAHLIANRAMGPAWYYGAIMQGMYSKIMAEFTQSLLSAADSTKKYIPSGLRKDTFNSKNWANLTTKVAAANGVKRDALFGFGTYEVLQTVLPKGTASDVALTYGLGEEWLKNGFISNVGRVKMIEVDPAIVPGTINNTVSTIDTEDNLFVSAYGGSTYAPIFGRFSKDSPITFEYAPSQTADFSIDITCTAAFGMKPVFGSKVGVIENVV